MFVGKSASCCSFVPLFFAHRGRRAFAGREGGGQSDVTRTGTWDDYHSRIVGRENDERNSAVPSGTRETILQIVTGETRHEFSPFFPTIFHLSSPLFPRVLLFFLPLLPSSFHPRERICLRSDVHRGDKAGRYSINRWME